MASYTLTVAHGDGRQVPTWELRVSTLDNAPIYEGVGDLDRLSHRALDDGSVNLVAEFSDPSVGKGSVDLNFRSGSFINNSVIKGWELGKGGGGVGGATGAAAGAGSEGGIEYFFAASTS